jgi:hypothetical protein
LKTLTVFFTVIITIGCAIHGGKKDTPKNFQGLWSGAIADEHGTVDVLLELKIDESKLKGTFKMLNAPGIEITMSIDIVDVEIDGNKIKFIIPITGEIDSDALEVEAELKNNRLEGSLKEMREGTDQILFVLTK